MPGTSQVASTPNCPLKDPKALSWPYCLTEYKRSLTCEDHKMIITNDSQSDSSHPGSSTILATRHSDIHEKESVKTQLTKLCFIVTFKILTLKVKSCIWKVHITALDSLKNWTMSLTEVLLIRIENYIGTKPDYDNKQKINRSGKTAQVWKHTLHFISTLHTISLWRLDEQSSKSACTFSMPSFFLIWPFALMQLNMIASHESL